LATVTKDITELKKAEELQKELRLQLGMAQEEERRRLSRELHDQMGQHLTALILGLKSLNYSVERDSQAEKILKQLQNLTEQIGQQIHSLALELRPTALDDLGLYTTLLNYIEEWSERANIEVDFHSEGFDDERLPPQIETTLYRIVQEALTNVLKHSGAKHVSLILENRKDNVLAIVEDDGRGFDVDAVMSSSRAERRLGLLGVKERVTLVGGVLNIESTPDKGTTLFVRIPKFQPR
jgi:signal transduction histidine kinase